MPGKLYLGAALALALLLAGWFSRSWYDTAGTVSVITHQVKATHKADTVTASHTLAAATHVQAVHARADTLRQRIHAEAAPTAIGAAHATYNAPAAAACPDYLDGDFQRLYDSGSAPAEPAAAGDVPPAHP